MIGRKNSELDGLLNSTNKDVVKKLQRPRNMHKLLRMFNNDFCPKCKNLAYVNSRRPMSDYCVDCQEVANTVLENILK